MGSQLPGLDFSWAGIFRRKTTERHILQSGVCLLPSSSDTLFPACTASACKPTPIRLWVRPRLLLEAFSDMPCSFTTPIPLGAEWMWPRALGRWPLSVWVCPSRSGEDGELSRVQRPADTGETDESEGTLMSLALCSVTHACCVNVNLVSVGGLARASPAQGSCAWGLGEFWLCGIPPAPASAVFTPPWDPGASGLCDLEQSGKRRWGVAGGDRHCGRD